MYGAVYRIEMELGTGRVREGPAGYVYMMLSAGSPKRIRFWNLAAMGWADFLLSERASQRWWHGMAMKGICFHNAWVGGWKEVLCGDSRDTVE